MPRRGRCGIYYRPRAESAENRKVIYGTYLSATGMTNEQARQNLIANNLANAETNGFRRQMALFQERAAEPTCPTANRAAG